MSQSSQYRPDIDGLRAVAIVAVVLYHTNLGFRGGYVGVDVFFVISGYLITRIIVQKLDHGEFSLREFWARRVCRILPASLALTIATIAAGSVILLPYDLHELGEAAVSHVAIMSNVYHWNQMQGYFAAESDLRPLLHTWSLAVEEQFYLFYPVFLVALKRFRSRNTPLIVVGIVSLVGSQVALHWDASASFFLLPTRAWELIVGALVFTWGENLSLHRRLANALSLVGLALVGYSILYFNNATPFPGLGAVAPVAGTASIMLANRTHTTWVGSVLSLRPLVFIGLLSYSLYLWHWPVLIYAQYILGEHLSQSVIFELLALIGVLSVVSWQFVEKPFRRQVKNYQPLKIVGVGMGLSLATGLVGIVLVASDGWPHRLADRPLFTQDAGFENSRFFTSRARDVPHALPRIGDPKSYEQARVLVWGDSHAPPVADLLDNLLRDRQLAGVVAARSQTEPIFSTNLTSAQWNDAVLAYLGENSISDIILVSRWSTWLINEQVFREVRTRLSRLAESGVRVWLLQQVPEQPFHVSRAINSKRFGVALPKGSTIDDHRRRQAVANAFLARLQSRQIRLLDPVPQFFDERGDSLLGTRDRSYYRDDDHLSSFGARVLLTPVLAACVDTIADEGAIVSRSSAHSGTIEEQPPRSSKVPNLPHR